MRLTGLWLGGALLALHAALGQAQTPPQSGDVAAPAFDAGMPDAGMADARTPDADALEGGLHDAGTPDAAAPAVDGTPSLPRVAAVPSTRSAPSAPALRPRPRQTEKRADEESYGAVAAVPMPSRPVAVDKVPRNVQRLDRAVLDEEHALGVHDALESRFGSVVLNDVQNNPLQPDLQYRGFTASPLLGSPQGLAVYQNGVRANEAFGDVVQWDLIPEFAIQEVQVMPGASPLYGLNALGGGLALHMKNGYRAPGHRVVALAGSFGRYQASAEYGRAFQGWAIYSGVSAFGEQGFRDESQSSGRHAYADLRQRSSEHELGASGTLAETDLNGNGVAPIELLALHRASVFTFPDSTRNRLVMLAADARRDFTDAVSLHGTVFIRHQRRNTLNGDAAELEMCEGAPGADILCDEEQARLLSESGMTIAATQPLYDGVFNTTETQADGFGGTLHLTGQGDIASRPNDLVLGLAYDGSAVAFLQRVELGRLTEERSVAGTDIFVGNDGYRTKLDVDTRHAGVFASDTYALADQLFVELSARLNVSNVELTDRTGDALDGDHVFARVNTAAGLTYSPFEALSVFASYGESSRAPSAIELACADPEEPCRVPNAFVADPPLEQVVTRAVELGLRGRVTDARPRPTASWSLAIFGSRNADDIIFVAAPTLGTGYFQNAGTTQRLGLEAALAVHAGLLRLHASYSILRATFESALFLPGGANPAAETAGDDDGGVLAVEKGDRIPGLPTHSLKTSVVVSPLPRWDIGLLAIARSSHPFRGDEANLVPEVNGYLLLHAHSSYRLLDSLQVFVKARNLLDTEHETFGVLAEPEEVLEGASDPRFLGPGNPLGVWAGVVLHSP